MNVLGREPEEVDVVVLHVLDPQPHHVWAVRAAKALQRVGFAELLQQFGVGTPRTGHDDGFLRRWLTTVDRCWHRRSTSATRKAPENVGINSTAATGGARSDLSWRAGACRPPAAGDGSYLGARRKWRRRAHAFPQVALAWTGVIVRADPAGHDT